MKKFAAFLLCAAVLALLCAPLQASDPNERDRFQRTKLMNAVLKGDLPKAKELIAQGADVKLVDEDKMSALCYAADRKRNAAEFVKILLDAGADPNHADRWSNTPLSRTLDPEVTALLAAKGANVNALVGRGKTQLFRAVDENRADLAKVLLENGADINAFGNYGITPLCLAAGDEEKLPLAELLISKGADVNARKDEKKWTPLARALYEGNIAAAKLLIEHGADVNLTVDGNWPVMFALAVSNEKLELTKLLLQKGAKLDVTNRKGETPFMVRSGKKCATPEELQWMISQGAVPGGTNKDGRSALFYAAKAHNADTVKFLASLGIYDLNARAKDGNTPLLQFMIEETKADELRQLMDLGCDPHALDNKGRGLMQRTAVRLADAANEKNAENPETAAKGKAKWENTLEVFNLLLQRGVSVNTQQNDGWTPLMWSTRMRAPLEVVQLMVNAGADPGPVTPKGESALTLAEVWCRPEVVEYLKQRVKN